MKVYNIIFTSCFPERPDILCVIETKINKDIVIDEKLDTFLKDDYASFWNVNKKYPGYSGIAVFTKFKPVNVVYGIGKEIHDEESRVITLEFESLYLICVSVPNIGDVFYYNNILTQRVFLV